ncbi:hypothetical protein [Sphingopyxis indica]|uniref:hypothetical protein n=1 Tax=Sphingopyxis indica TaxID=436663 RepID=UPI001481EF6D|nr:hypothetical protein [Sphingopyxis indica]
MVNMTPPNMPPALAASWRRCEQRCPKETARLVSEFTEKMIELDRISEGAGIERTLDF